MVMLSDYRLVEQGGLFFREGKCRKLLPDMRPSAVGAWVASAHDDRFRRSKSETDNTTAILRKMQTNSP